MACFLFKLKFNGMLTRSARSMLETRPGGARFLVRILLSGRLRSKSGLNIALLLPSLSQEFLKLHYLTRKPRVPLEGKPSFASISPTTLSKCEGVVGVLSFRRRVEQAVALMTRTI